MKKTTLFLFILLTIKFVNAQKSRIGHYIKKVGEYDINEKRTGEWKFYSLNGNLDVVEYLDGKPNGITKLYDNKGRLYSTSIYLNGKRNGEHKNYYNSGELHNIGKYVYGEKDGKWKSYYENSQLESIGNYKNDFQQGEWKEYYQNGQLKEVGEYSEGFKNGEWKEYNEKGKLTSTTEHKASSRAFYEYVFRDTSIGYNKKTKEILEPTLDKPYNRCYKKENPNHIVCGGPGGANYTFIEKGEKAGDFKVTVFHPSDRVVNKQVSMSTFVKDGKVIQQSKCLFNDQWNDEGSVRKNHYILTHLECYVVTPKMCEAIGDIRSIDDLKEKWRFEEFVKVLKSPSYKKAILEAHTFNYRNAFFKANMERTYDYYSTLKSGFFDPEKQGKIKELSVVELEKDSYIKNSKSLLEVAKRAKFIIKTGYLVPCQKLLYGKLLAETKK